MDETSMIEDAETKNNYILSRLDDFVILIKTCKHRFKNEDVYLCKLLDFKECEFMECPEI